ncbi:hypothetical protein ACWC9T_01255 [Kitasatospora sp. NPDC001159]
MAASLHALLGPLPAAPHHRRTRRSQRLLAAAVLGLTLPLAAATTAVAGPSPNTRASIEAEPSAALPQHSGRRTRPDDRDFHRAHRHRHRHRPASAPERPDATVERAPDQAPDRTPGQATDQSVEQQPEQARDQSVEADQPDSDADTPDAPAPVAPAAPSAPDTGAAASGQTVAAASGQTVAAAAPAVLPARWQDASTLQLPLGVGLGLIGCGLALIGLSLRKG